MCVSVCVCPSSAWLTPARLFSAPQRDGGVCRRRTTALLPFPSSSLLLCHSTSTSSKFLPHLSTPITLPVTLFQSCPQLCFPPFWLVILTSLLPDINIEHLPLSFFFICLLNISFCVLRVKTNEMMFYHHDSERLLRVFKIISFPISKFIII